MKKKKERILSLLTKSSTAREIFHNQDELDQFAFLLANCDWCLKSYKKGISPEIIDYTYWTSRRRKIRNPLIYAKGLHIGEFNAERAKRFGWTPYTDNYIYLLNEIDGMVADLFTELFNEYSKEIQEPPSELFNKNLHEDAKRYINDMTQPLVDLHLLDTTIDDFKLILTMKLVVTAPKQFKGRPT